MFSKILRFFSSGLQKYNRCLLEAPYKTKMLTTGTTYFLGDCVCQNLIEDKSAREKSMTRSLKQGAVGMFFAGPSLHIWHSNILPKLVKPFTGRLSYLVAAVVFNELIIGSYFVASLLFAFEALKKRDINAGIQNMKEKFPSAILMSIKFWTGVSILNFGFMPVHFRPVFVSCWSIVWQSYLSYVSNNRLKQPNQPNPSQKSFQKQNRPDLLKLSFEYLPLD